MRNIVTSYRKATSYYYNVLEKYPFLHWVVAPTIILTGAFIINGIIILLCGYNPIEAYVAALDVSFGSFRAVGETLVKSTPYLMTGLSVAIAFRCGIWNIGAEGQFLMGALAATWFGTKISNATSQYILDSGAVLSLPGSLGRWYMRRNPRYSQGNARCQRSY